jgi:hypothetical protein
MKNIIFISSYPKSGNTWVRIIIAMLIYTTTVSKKENLKKFNFKNLKEVGLFSQLNNFKKIDGYKIQKNGLLDTDFTINNWINAQKIINKNSKTNFFKTHNMSGKINGKKFTDTSVCGGFIYITRDPRDVAISKAKYMNTSFDTSIDRMLNDDKVIVSPGKVNEFINTWENHVLSWYNTKDIPRLMLRYEDMLIDTKKSIKQIINFINTNSQLHIKDDDYILDYVLENTNFNNLKLMEEKMGFVESTVHSRFFREGKSKQWEVLLSANQIHTIQKKLRIPMQYLGYL